MSVINTNIGAINASNYLTINSENLATSIKKLASGSRLANPVDDAAGVAVSGNLVARIARLTQATQGAQNVISFAQTADGFLATLQSITTRLSELTQAATNGAFGSTDRANYVSEVTVLTGQIQNIVANANFNNNSIFSAGLTAAGSNITVAINATGNTDALAAAYVTNIIALTSAVASLTSTLTGTAGAVGEISNVNGYIASITTSRATVNADISKFNFFIANIRTENINVKAANSRIADLDVADESTNFSKQNILTQAATSVLAQANTSQQSVLSLLR